MSWGVSVLSSVRVAHLKITYTGCRNPSFVFSAPVNAVTGSAVVTLWREKSGSCDCHQWFKAFHQSRSQLGMTTQHSHKPQRRQVSTNTSYTYLLLYFNTNTWTFYTLQFQNRVIFKAFGENYLLFFQSCVTAGRLPSVTILISAYQWTSRGKTKPRIRHKETERDREGDSNGKKRCVSVSYLQLFAWILLSFLKVPKWRYLTAVICFSSAFTNSLEGSLWFYL